MQSLMGETPFGGAASLLFSPPPTPHTPHPIPCLVFSIVVTPSASRL
ncbi:MULTISPECIES: hypothetical protein [unclassified Moorena]|nr:MULTISPECIES: hypothetical protein [unclassified Moorena]NEO17662.1 hypothetical protein [Moorena sp. SIO3E8]NEQ04207.1 hypothetical protein [Moorena sp. SIO3F7]